MNKTNKNKGLNKEKLNEVLASFGLHTEDYSNN